MKKIAFAAWLVVASALPGVCASFDILNVGIQYTNDESWDNAILWLGKAIDSGELLPDQLRVAHYDRAKAYFNSGNPAAAIPEYTAALAFTPDDVQLLTERAFAYLEDGQKDHALADLKVAHDKKPKNARIDFLIGLVNWANDRPEDAATAFGEALKVSKSRYAWLWLKLSELKQKKETAIFRDFYRSDRWPSMMVDFYSGKADEKAVFFDVKDYGDSENCEATFYIAEWRLAHNATEAAKSMLQKAVSDCPKDDMEARMARLELGKLP